MPDWFHDLPSETGVAFYGVGVAPLEPDRRDQAIAIADAEAREQLAAIQKTTVLGAIMMFTARPVQTDDMTLFPEAIGQDVTRETARFMERNARIVLRAVATHTRRGQSQRVMVSLARLDFPPALQACVEAAIAVGAGQVNNLTRAESITDLRALLIAEARRNLPYVPPPEGMADVGLAPAAIPSLDVPAWADVPPCEPGQTLFGVGAARFTVAHEQASAMRLADGRARVALSRSVQRAANAACKLTSPQALTDEAFVWEEAWSQEFTRVAVVLARRHARIVVRRFSVADLTTGTRTVCSLARLPLADLIEELDPVVREQIGSHADEFAEHLRREHTAAEPAPVPFHAEDGIPLHQSPVAPAWTEHAPTGRPGEMADIFAIGHGAAIAAADASAEQNLRAFLRRALTELVRLYDAERDGVDPDRLRDAAFDELDDLVRHSRVRLRFLEEAPAGEGEPVVSLVDLPIEHVHRLLVRAWHDAGGRADEARFNRRVLLARFTEIRSRLSERTPIPDGLAPID